MGIGLVSGLLEVQRLARAEHLASLTVVFYVAAYAGFTLPAVMSAIPVAAITLRLVLVGLALASCVTVLASSRSHPPLAAPASAATAATAAETT